jgi:hypothetical protein
MCFVRRSRAKWTAPYDPPPSSWPTSKSAYVHFLPALAVLSILNVRMHQIDGNRDNSVEAIVVAAALRSTGEAGVSWVLLV